MSSQKLIGPGFVGLLVLLLFAWITLVLDGRPSPKAADAAPAVFSSARALKHLEVIAKKPHPTGSAANLEVQKYLEQTLADLGLTVETQSKMVAANAGFSSRTLAPITNVITRMKGTTSKETLLVVAHYDSVYNAPGAGDDGAAVSGMLETISCLKAGEPIENDIIFLFSDGEEFGLLGAQLFVDEHPWASEVDFVINFEGRGNGGPSVMFETSPNNSWVIQEYLKASANPVTHSFAYEVYKRMPNATDFTPLMTIPNVLGVNFAFLAGANNYHSASDSVENLQESSLQHHGSQMLALLRHFGNLSMDRTSTANAIYFYVPLLGSVSYSSGMIIPLLLFGTLLVLAVLVVGFRQKKLTVAGLIGSVPINLVFTALAILIAVMAWKIFAELGKPEMGFTGHPYNSGVYLVGLLLVSFALMIGLVSWTCSKLRVENQSAGSLLIWLAFSWLMGVSVPGASYIFIWPTLFASIGLLVVLLKPDMDQQKHTLILFLGGIPAVMIVLALLPLVYLAMPLGGPVPVSAGVVGLFTGLLGMMLAAPFIWALPSRKWAPSGMALVGLLALASVTFKNRSANAERPSQQSVSYFADSDGQTNKWIAIGRLKSWNSGFFKGEERIEVPFFSRPVLAQTAGATQTSPPHCEVVVDKPGKRYKTVDLLITHPVPGTGLFIRVEGGPVRNGSLGGVDLGRAPNDITLLSIPAEGVTFQVKVPRFKDFTVNAYAIIPGLPADVPHEAVPDWVIPPQNAARYQHSSIIGTRFLVPASIKEEAPANTEGN